MSYFDLLRTIGARKEEEAVAILKSDKWSCKNLNVNHFYSPHWIIPFPLVVATEKNCLKVAKILLDMGANPHTICKKKEMSAYQLATNMNNQELLKLFE